jgi:hypothetical protein
MTHSPRTRDLPVGVYRTRSGAAYYASFQYYNANRLRLQKHLGTFTTVKDAVAARERAVAEHREVTA